MIMTITFLLIALSALLAAIQFGRSLRKMFDFNKADGVCVSDFKAFSYMLFMFAFVCGFFVCFSIVDKAIEGPKAIDVYRNRTELRITSVNGVPTDTVVVWKGEVYENI